MKIPGAVIFDMDGVLIYSEPIHIEIEKKLFEKLKISVSADLHRTYLGTSGEYMYRDIKLRFGLPETIQELLQMDESFRSDYFRSLKALELNEGVLNLLHQIKEAGLRIAVATSSSPQLASILLERCNVSSFFDAIVTTAEAGNSKPAPDVYLLAAKKIGVEPADCVVFEDSPNGLSSAHGAGMFCIAVQTESVDIRELSRADFLLRTFRGTSFRQIVKLFSQNYLALKRSE